MHLQIDHLWRSSCKKSPTKEFELISESTCEMNSIQSLIIWAMAIQLISSESFLANKNSWKLFKKKFGKKYASEKEEHHRMKTFFNKAENADFQSYAAGRGYITIAMLMLRNAKQC